MLKINYDEIAEKLVNECMRVKENEVIQVSGDIGAWELIENIEFYIIKNGAFPLIRLSSESGYRRKMKEINPEYISKTGKHQLELTEHINGRIAVNSSTEMRNRGLSEESLKAASSAYEQISSITKKNRVRSIVVTLPVKEMAEAVNMDFEEFHDLSWKAFLVPLNEVYKECQRVREVFGDGEKIHLTNEKGTDITMSSKGRKIRIDDGIFDEEDIENHFLITNIPCGEVYLAPVEESVNGVAVFDEIYANGSKIRDLKCTFRDGKLVDFSSEIDDVKPFETFLSTHSGDARMVAELGLGMNPEVHKPVGYIFLDEKIYGSCHIAIGDNYVYGGVNRSSLHFDMVIMNPTLVVNDVTVFEKGKIVV